MALLHCYTPMYGPLNWEIFINPWVQGLSDHFQTYPVFQNPTPRHSSKGDRNMRFSKTCAQVQQKNSWLAVFQMSKLFIAPGTLIRSFKFQWTTVDYNDGKALAGSQAASQALSQVYTSQNNRWGWLKIAPEIHWFIIIIISSCFPLMNIG